MSDINDLEVEASITIDAEHCAAAIELYCADYLLAPPKGIYSNSQVEPVMVDGGDYYSLVKDVTGYKRIPVTDLSKVKKGLSVYTTKECRDYVVVSSLQLSNKDKCLSTLPIKPYRGMKIVELLINNQINSFIKYRKGVKDIHTGIQNHFKPGISEEDYDRLIGAITEQYSDTNLTLRTFMGRHDWNLYFVKIKMCTAVVQRSMDWRAYDWTCRMDSKEWK